MLNNFKLRGRMLLGYSVPVVLITGLAIGVYSTSQAVGKNFEHALVANDRARVSDALELKVSQIGRQARGYALTLDKDLLSRYEAGVKELNEVQEKALELTKNAIPEQRERMAKMVTISEQYEKITRGQIEAAKTGNRKLVIDTVESGADLLKTFGMVMKEFDSRQGDVVKDAENSTKNSLNLLVTMSVVGATASLAIALAVAYVISSAIANTLNQAASEIASSSAQIASAVEEQERTVSQQASSVNETSTTMGELGTSSRQSAEQAEVSASGARHALSLTEGGTKAVRQTLDEMTTLKDKVGAIAEQILRLSEQTNQIGNISGLVGDLAAGEHGKGFAVVAEEIRKLADQSRQSADKIGGLVSDIQNAINTTVMVTDEGTKTVNAGMNITERTANAFSGVLEAINNVAMNNQQIALNIRQQGKAVQQVLDAMSSINKGAQENAAGITQIKTGTQQLNESAKSLEAIL